MPYLRVCDDVGLIIKKSLPLLNLKLIKQTVLSL